VSNSPVPDSASTAYEVFLAGLGHDASAAECEGWAARHAGDQEEGRALVDAGWVAAREGRGEEALELFHRAAKLGGEFGRDAQVGMVDQLYALERDEEAGQALRALRAELEDRPCGAADLRVFDDITEALSDAGEYEPALGWCQAGLDRAAEIGDTPEAEGYRRGLRNSRSFLREELGIERDAQDLAVEAEAEASLTAIGELIHRRLDELPWQRGLDLPTDGERFDGIVLRWVRGDFAAVRSRWPEETAHYGDDYDTYAERIQREARGYATGGAGRVHLVSGTLADYEVYARREGRDPAQQSTRQDYGEHLAMSRPGQAPLWPPARNAPCWCDSGRTYKKCCGAPAKN
jgi:tetratricopeptide (TPR) repeat protein